MTPPTGSIPENSQKPPQATIRVGAKTYHIVPNDEHSFERILIQPKDKIAVQIAYPQGDVGDKVAVEAVDGGHFDNKTISQVPVIDADHNINFTFNATDQLGIFRVVVVYRNETRELDFWAGPEPTFVKR